jgi:hypothetical protein
MTWRDWQHRDVIDIATRHELFNAGIARPENMESITLDYHSETGAWTVTIEHSGGTVIFDEPYPNWYDDEMRAIAIEEGIPTESIATAYERSKG